MATDRRPLPARPLRWGKPPGQGHGVAGSHESNDARWYFSFIHKKRPFTFQKFQESELFRKKNLTTSLKFIVPSLWVFFNFPPPEKKIKKITPNKLPPAPPYGPPKTGLGWVSLTCRYGSEPKGRSIQAVPSRPWSPGAMGNQLPWLFMGWSYGFFFQTLEMLKIFIFLIICLEFLKKFTPQKLIIDHRIQRALQLKFSKWIKSGRQIAMAGIRSWSSNTFGEKWCLGLDPSSGHSHTTWFWGSCSILPNPVVSQALEFLWIPPFTADLHVTFSN